MSISWVYVNDYGRLCHAETRYGFYSIYQDEDRLGFPLCLEFHSEKDNYCEKGSVEVPLGQATELDEIQMVAENHLKSIST